MLFCVSWKYSAPLPDPGEVGAQAVALRIFGDQVAFYGAQDTLSDDQGRRLKILKRASFKDRD